MIYFFNGCIITWDYENMVLNIKPKQWSIRFYEPVKSSLWMLYQVCFDSRHGAIIANISGLYLPFDKRDIQT